MATMDFANAGIIVGVVVVLVAIFMIRWWIFNVRSNTKALFRVASVLPPAVPGNAPKLGPAAVIGRVGQEAGNHVLKAPITNTPCVFYETKVLSCESAAPDFRKTTFSDGSALHDGEWQVVAQEHSSSDFYLSEQPGSHMPRIQVQAGRHQLMSIGLDTPDHTFGYATTGFISRAHPRVDSFLRSHSVIGSSTMRYEETIIPVGAIMMAVGSMQQSEDGGDMLLQPICDTEGAEYALSLDNQNCFSQMLARNSWRRLAGSIVATSHRGLLGPLGLDLAASSAWQGQSISLVPHDQSFGLKRSPSMEQEPPNMPSVVGRSPGSGSPASSPPAPGVPIAAALHTTTELPRLTNGTVDFYAVNMADDMRKPEAAGMY